MVDFQKHITALLKKQTSLKDIPLEIPSDKFLGDFAFPCFVLAKSLKKNPVQIAKDVAFALEPDKIVKEIRAEGPYVNFFVFKEKLISEVLNTILKEKDTYGMQKKTNKKILVEYPGPNTNKPLHLGHLRNMCLGFSLIRILEANGHTVIPVNINNDRGIHICKSMLAYNKFGKNDSPEKSKLKSDHFVGKYYVKFNEEVQKNKDLEILAKELLQEWEAGDKNVMALWKKMNNWAFAGFDETYTKFGIHFKKEYYESKTYEKGREIVQEGLRKGLFKEKDGAVIIDLTKEGYGEKVLLRSDGTTVYMTQDLYLAQVKYEDFKYDESIYVVASEQNYHFKILFEVLKKLKKPYADKCHHFSYGMVHLTSGRMKSREGTVVDADNLLEEMETMASEETKKRYDDITQKELAERANKIALGAIRFYILKFDPVKDMLYNPEESISFEGETGPYLQYTYARIRSILAKHKGRVKSEDVSILQEDEEIALVDLLEKYPSIVKDAGNYKIHTLARYLIDLAQAFNNFYHQHQVLAVEKDIKDARLVLITCVDQVLKNGLTLLGIDVLERM